MNSESNVTNVKDRNYGLVSALYHTLKQEQSCAQFEQDAEEIGDQEVEECFEEICSELKERSAKISVLLQARLTEGDKRGGGASQAKRMSQGDSNNRPGLPQ